MPDLQTIVLKIITLYPLLLSVFFILAIVILIIYCTFFRSNITDRPPDVYSAKDIENYMKKNNMIRSIENENMYIYIDDYEEGYYIRCVNKLKKNDFFTVTGSKELLITFWAIIQRSFFYKNYTCDGLLTWFENQATYTYENLFVSKNNQ